MSVSDEVLLPEFCEELVVVKGAIDGVRSKPGMGGMIVSFHVPMAWKMDAMSLTDHHGVMLKLVVSRVPRGPAAKKAKRVSDG